MPLTVFLAHSGRSLFLGCSSTARCVHPPLFLEFWPIIVIIYINIHIHIYRRVSEVQQLLAEVTGAPPSDQILTHQGAPLSPTALLSDYGLAGAVDDSEMRTNKDVFLYSKAFLRPDAPPPRPEVLPDLLLPQSSDTNVAAAASSSSGAHPQQRQHQPPPTAPHPLDSASSPLLRSLPEYHRQFEQHCRQAETAAASAASRVALCCRLVNEAEVQAMAVDAAMASVEPHYAFICSSQAAFQSKFSRRFAVHQDVLSTLDADVDFLNSVELPEPLRSESTSTLADLLDVAELRGVATECRRSHRRFAARVAELESLHAALRSDVDALFMRAPSVDLDELSQGLAAATAAADEEAAFVQSLAADAKRAGAALDDASIAAASAGGSSSSATQQQQQQQQQQQVPPPGLQDIVGMLEAMHESHVTIVLPRVLECTAEIESFAQRCVDAKNSLSADALLALRTIASQQSKIREMKEAMAPFPAALDRQDAQITRLLSVRRLPAAYKQALAECVRRAAFSEKYSAFAADLAERMGRFRSKEAAMRNKFRDHVAGQLPDVVLEKMGLTLLPPHCHVNVSDEESQALLSVTPEDLRNLQLPRYDLYTTTATTTTTTTATTAVVVKSSAVGGEEVVHEESATSGASSTSTSTSTPPLENAPPLQPPPPPPPPSSSASSPTSRSLLIQNAQLRAELASQVALGCIRAAELAAMGPLPTTTTTTTSTPTATAALSATTGSSSLASTVPQAAPVVVVLGPEVLQKFERALAAKDALMTSVQESAAKQTAVLQSRIEELESQLLKSSTTTAAAAVVSGPQSEVLPASSSTQPPPPPLPPVHDDEK